MVITLVEEMLAHSKVEPVSKLLGKQPSMAKELMLEIQN